MTAPESREMIALLREAMVLLQACRATPAITASIDNFLARCRTALGQ